MVEILEIILYSLLTALGGYGLFVLFRKLLSKYLLRRSIRPAQIRNKHKEQEFIKNLLEDIRTNTDDWFLMSEAISDQATLLANDRKGIGIVYTNNNGNATILLNLDGLRKFDKFAEDTVKISVHGDHVKDFLLAAEDIIDRRGKEIAFFQEELEKRL